ncbi:MAG: hypothetical protein ACYDCH_13945, partial [Gaiellaceae bacterium]
MRRLARILGALMLGGGVLTLAWAILVWQWQDPFTALYTHWQQNALAQRLDREFAAFHPARVDRAHLAAERRQIAVDARRLQHEVKPGQAIGRIVIGRIGLNMVVVEGTDESSLTKGPGRDAR